MANTVTLSFPFHCSRGDGSRMMDAAPDRLARCENYLRKQRSCLMSLLRHNRTHVKKPPGTQQLRIQFLRHPPVVNRCIPILNGSEILSTKIESSLVPTFKRIRHCDE